MYINGSMFANGKYEHPKSRIITPLFIDRTKDILYCYTNVYVYCICVNEKQGELFHLQNIIRFLF